MCIADSAAGLGARRLLVYGGAGNGYGRHGREDDGEDLYAPISTRIREAN